jgi:galactoside O-acetyltransferase
MNNRIIRELSAWSLEFCRWAPGGIGQRLRLKVSAKRLKNIGSDGYIAAGVSFSGWENISLGDNVSFSSNCIISSNNGTIKIGNNCSLNTNVTLVSDFGSIEIGQDVIIGMNVVMRSANHKFNQSPNIPIRDQGHNYGEIIIKDDVWIGANVTIMPNVTIESHCIIGAGAVVTKDIPKESIAVGIPARVVKKIK